jgi:hypothetical protein
MKNVRRPLVAVGTALVLVALEAIADPTGLLALVGWPGGAPQSQLGWPLARYVVFLPVVVAVVWWSAVRAGARFWTMAAGTTLAVLLAQAATSLAMTGDVLFSGWAGGYVTAKALPAALVVAAVTRLAGGPRVLERREPAVVWPYAVLLAALAPLVAGSWWSGATYTAWIPAPRADHGAVALISGVLLLAGAGIVAMRWMRRRVDGLLGVWLGALVAGGMLGVCQAVVGLFADDGLTGDLWPAMAAYVHIADGLSYGAALGWIPAVAAVVVDRIRAARTPVSAERTGVPVSVAASVAAFVAVAAVAAVVGSTLAAVNPAQAADAANPPAGFLRADHGRITDGDGNEVLLRGVNVNQLVDFYRPRADVPATRPLTEQDFAGMASYGFDVARLNLSWSALEPQRGRFDSAYLGRVKDAVSWAKANGIRVVLDMHQDGWSDAATASGTVCRPGTDPMWGYDGAPAWATIADGAPRCSFTGRDISPAGDRAFEHFWFDTDGIQTALAQTWGKLAAQFRDEPAVAGYDLINEPGFGETAPVTTSLQLGRFYDSAIHEIRAAGAPQIVFVEPSILWSGLGFDSGPRPGFTSDRNIVFSPHLYAESITMDYSLGLPTIVGIERQFELAERVAAEYGAPLWSGEYGYWGDDASIASRVARYATAEDAHALGSAYWVWKQACGDPQNGIGSLGLALVPQDCSTGGDAPRNAQLLGVLSRAYPVSAPGRIGTLHADGASLLLTGTSPRGTCGLDVWIPGATRPAVHAAGVQNGQLAQQPGGWRFTGCTSGDYRVTTS